MCLVELALCFRSTCQFRRKCQKSNHMLSATTNIELEFFTQFRQLQNQCIYILDVIVTFLPVLVALSGCPTLLPVMEISISSITVSKGPSLEPSTPYIFLLQIKRKLRFHITVRFVHFGINIFAYYCLIAKLY